MQKPTFNHFVNDESYYNFQTRLMNISECDFLDSHESQNRLLDSSRTFVRLSVSTYQRSFQNIYVNFCIRGLHKNLSKNFNFLKILQQCRVIYMKM